LQPKILLRFSEIWSLHSVISDCKQFFLDHSCFFAIYILESIDHPSGT